MSDVLHIGFTGTRHGMSDRQWSTVHRMISRSPLAWPHHATHDSLRVRHGACEGADVAVHDMCCAIRRAGNLWSCGPIAISVRPGPPSKHHRDCQIDPALGDICWSPLPHMKRNAAIVAASHIMIAAPFENEPQPRGGTWATIGMARRALKRGTLRALYVVGREGQLLDHERWP